MSSPLKSGGAIEGGVHVAEVNMSTNLRMKKRGKVPPRLDTLRAVVSILNQMSKGADLRSEESHVGTANVRVGDLCVESADGNEHDGAHECAEDVLDDNDAEVWKISTTAGEDHDGKLSKSSCNQSAHECPTPKTHWSILLAPFSSIVA